STSLGQVELVKLNAGAVGRVEVLGGRQRDVARENPFDAWNLRSARGFAAGTSHAGSHDARRVVTVREPQRVADFVEGDSKPQATVRARSKDLILIDDYLAAAFNPADGIGVDVGSYGANITGRNRQARGRSFDGLHPQIARIHVDDHPRIVLL